MKNLLIIIIIFLSTFMLSFSQTNWDKYSSNPILVEGPQGNWDAQGVLASYVIFEGGTYHMWYTGDAGNIVKLGYATSPDGITWTKFEENPILIEGLHGSWEEGGPGSPTVIFDGTSYHMWYDAPDSSSVFRIGYAISTDRITWSKFTGNPVLDVGPLGSWDAETVAEPWVIYNGTTYKMWYRGYNGIINRIGYATSLDGIIWSKHATNPVLTEGPVGAWDNVFAVSPEVIFDGNIYQMWYGGFDGSFGRRGYATSMDGFTWEKFVNNPVIDVGLPGSWDDFFIGRGGVRLDGSTYQKWYAGLNGTEFIWRIGYAADSTVVGIGDNRSDYVSTSFILYQNYPNPFNPKTSIQYTISSRQFVSLKVYDVLGNEVATLVNEEKPAGTYEVEWNASALPSGVYFYQLKTVPNGRQAEGFVETKKMILMK